LNIIGVSPFHEKIVSYEFGVSLKFFYILLLLLINNMLWNKMNGIILELASHHHSNISLPQLVLSNAPKNNPTNGYTPKRYESGNVAKIDMT
jgi:hypothetical protein